MPHCITAVAERGRPSAGEWLLSLHRDCCCCPQQRLMVGWPATVAGHPPLHLHTLPAAAAPIASLHRLLLLSRSHAHHRTPNISLAAVAAAAWLSPKQSGSSAGSPS